MTLGTAKSQDAGALRQLWKTCFGDTEDYVNIYFTHAFVPEDVFVLRDPELSAMAISFPVRYVSEDGAETDGAYLYAVCTAPQQRGKGYFRTLMEWSERTLAARGCSFVCLKPGSAALRQTYARMGYGDCFTCRERRVQAGESYVNLQKLAPEHYDALRQMLLQGGFIDYPPETLAHQARLGTLFSAEGGGLFGIGAAERYADTLILKEYLGDEALLPGIATGFDAAEMSVRTPGGAQPFAMAKALSGGACPQGYLAFAFD